jgi:hypothetical protein
VVYYSKSSDSSVHKLFANFGNIPDHAFMSSPQFMVYPRDAEILPLEKQYKIISQVADAGKEFFNLRGQRLPHGGIKHANGVVLERIIGPTGKASVKINLAPKE